MKNNKGITLIALVITIIVLLILAGVSIAMLTGENGILTQAENADVRTAQAEAADKINMALNGELANLYAEEKLTGKNDSEIAATNGLTGEGFTITPDPTNVDSATGKPKADGLILTISKTVEGRALEGTITKSGDSYTVKKAPYPDET